MEKGWTLIYTTDILYKADIIVELLAESEIEAVVFNKRDSAYQTFGDQEVYVREEHVQKALEIIKTSEL
jgi:hypothetical protein